MELSELALQKLLQLFPELSGYIVSFKDISEDISNEDAGLRVGMFIVLFGTEYYYIPVIAKDDTVYPIDSMFSAAEECFYPLTRALVDKAVAMGQTTLGKPSKTPNTVPTNPSVYNLVTPPRTGKFVYASSSRMVEFLAILPDLVKKAALEKMASDSDTYSTLHKLFGLENILAALKPSTTGMKVVSKPAVEIMTAGSDMSDDEVQTILAKGYALRGENTTNRVAVMANDNDRIGAIKTVSSVDQGYDYQIVTKAGESIAAFLPRMARMGPQKAALFTTHNDRTDDVFALFSDGSYAISNNMISQGEPSDGKLVLQKLFKTNPPKTVMEVANGECVALFSPEMTLITVARVYSVAHSTTGVTLSGSCMLAGSSGKFNVFAFRNTTNVDASDRNNIYVPPNTLVVELGESITGGLEDSPVAAIKKLELTTLTALGSAMDIGFDGVEFSVNGRPIGGEIKLVEVLVGHEGIAPDRADTFIKQAKEQRFVKVYLSKKADYEPGEIPQYGDAALPQENNFGADVQANFSSNLKASTQTQDPQVVESMVISELLQATDMVSLVREYLPDISKAVDRLGRTLFLARLNTEKLSQSQNANEVSSFISNLRNVYRLLGDNAVRLENMASGPEAKNDESGMAE